LWNDHELRDRLGKAAYRYATENFSDEAAVTALGRILDSVEDEKGTDKATHNGLGSASGMAAFYCPRKAFNFRKSKFWTIIFSSS
jgi:hypothetical protein